MTQIDNAEWIAALHHTEELLTTFLTDWDAGLDLLMQMFEVDKIEDKNEARAAGKKMASVVGVLLGFIRSDVHAHLRDDPNLTLEQILTDIQLGFLSQRAELDS